MPRGPASAPRAPLQSMKKSASIRRAAGEAQGANIAAGVTLDVGELAAYFRSPQPQRLLAKHAG